MPSSGVEQKVVAVAAVAKCRVIFTLIYAGGTRPLFPFFHPKKGGNLRRLRRPSGTRLFAPRSYPGYA